LPCHAHALPPVLLVLLLLLLLQTMAYHQHSA
jgi:hypothetical protein